MDRSYQDVLEDILFEEELFDDDEVENSVSDCIDSISNIEDEDLNIDISDI